MLYKTVALGLTAQSVAGFSPAPMSKISASRIARISDVTMAKKSVGDLSEADLKGKKVLVRCDLNVPLNGKTITDGEAARFAACALVCRAAHALTSMAHLP